jgi:LmbE family N-acetylglucosaminyl deacetylase
MTPKRLVQMRQKEQIAAGKILGLKDVFFLDHQDTQLEVNQEFKEELVRIIRTVKPHRVIGLDPTFYFALEATFEHGYHFEYRSQSCRSCYMDAVFPLSRDRLTFPQHEKEGLEPHRVDELWIVNWGDKEPCHFVDITPHFEKKLEAIEAHVSQFADFKDIEKRVRRATTCRW